MKIIVVGSGVAGMTAALEADEAGHDVILITKDDIAQSNTRYAQGGVAVVTTPDDTVDSHVADTLVAGAGLSDKDTVTILCSEGPAAIDELIERGVQFDRDGDGLAHGLEAAHSHARILHAGGDATGAGIAYALVDRVGESGIDVREDTTVLDLIVTGGRVTGVTLLDGEGLEAEVVILATGGAGQLYPYSTNPEIATADGLGMALRAGVVASDLEFYQFHPTSLDAPGNFLVSEAVRGEGATLIDESGHRFMTDLHPDAELAPRDVVARGIAAQMIKQPGVPVRLDATAKGGEFLAKRFPNIDAACRAQGYDWGTVPIPVTPAAHYYMGGIRVDEWGRTSMPGLYAVGEVSCTGLNGANRLASNSLLEGAVFGSRVIVGLAETPDSIPFDDEWATPVSVDLSDADDAEEMNRTDLQHLMWGAAGLSRTAADLEAAMQKLRGWHAPTATDAKAAEDTNLLIVARAVVASALARQESRGGHYRTDFLDTDPAQAMHSAVVSA